MVATAGRVALWDVAERCNMSCRYCYHLLDGKPFSGDEVALDVALARLEWLREHGVTRVHLVGGEPFLMTGFGVLLARARALGIETIVTTNGSMHKHYRNRELMRSITVAEVSLDSLDTPYLVTLGRLTSRVIAQGIELIRTAGAKLHIITTVTKANLAQLPEIVRFAREHGVTTHKFQPVWIPAGHPLAPEYALSREEVSRLVRFARSIYEWVPPLADFYAYVEECAASGVRRHNCTAATRYIYLDVHGNVRRCPSLHASVAERPFLAAPVKCDAMSLDCLSCFNLIENFDFQLKAAGEPA